MKSDNHPDYETIYVPSSVWTVIPHADLEVFHDMMHVCKVRVHIGLGTLTLLEGDTWQVRKYLTPEERSARGEELQQVSVYHTERRGGEGSSGSTQR